MMRCSLTNEQFEYLKEKYGRLISKAARTVKSDQVLHSPQDCEQELYIAMFDAVEGFKKKTSLPEEDFLESELFGKYLKTSIWNRKNTLGSKVSKNYDLNHALPINEELLDGSDPDCSTVNIFKDIDFDCDELEFIKATIKDPSLYKRNGKVNISKAAKILNIPKSQVEHTIYKLKQKFINE